MDRETEISLRLRESIHTACRAAAIDAVTDYADEDPKIPNPIVRCVSLVNVTCDIMFCSSRQW